jgi:outer membrane protein OmpA-like peptidoglycan-associated protein
MEMIRGRTLDEVRRYDWFKALVALGLFLLAYFVCGKWDASTPAPAAPVAAVTTPAAAVVAAPALAQLGLAWKEGKLYLTGVVKDEASRKALVDAAIKQMGGDSAKVIDQLTVDAKASNAPGLEKIADLLAWGSDGRGLRIEGDKVTLTGQVPVEGDKVQRGEVAARLFGSSMKIDNQIVVKAPSAPGAVKLYFDTGKSAVQADAKVLLADIIKYGNASPNSKIQISGFHDKRGGTAANAELAKNRAKAVRDLLQAAGLAADRMILVPPVELVGSADDKEARRVDVSIAQ